MKIGVMLGAGTDQDSTLEGMIQFAKRVESLGFSDLWMANIFEYDAITVLGIMGRETSTIGLGTSVVPSYPRHPAALAQQAMTASVVTGGRFQLGLGLSHKVVIENMFGLSYDKPAKHMREYLDVLVPLMQGQAVSYEGEQYQVNCQLKVKGLAPVPVIVAALGPKMLEIAGAMSDGTTTWMTGMQTLEQYIIPTINRAANDAGKPLPKVVAGLPIALTNNVDAAKEKIAAELKTYGVLPSYRAMLDREGAAGPADVSLLGSESELRKQIQRLRDIGVTDFNAAVIDVEDGAFDRTLMFLQSEMH
jgi:5,10-methylenetetrahydromethanopterin reductase